MKFKSKDAVRSFVILLFDIFGRLCFHLKHYGVLKNEQIWACSFWQNFVVVDVSTVGSVGNLYQQSDVFTVLGRRPELRGKALKTAFMGTCFLML